MVRCLNVVADFHEPEGLRKVLGKFDNLICLGDIGAAVEQKEIFSNWQRYKKSWKAFSSKDFSQISDEDREWFARTNIIGWKKQLDAIKSSGKRFILIEGNSDFAMLSFFPECREYLNKTLKNSKLEFIEKPIIKFEGKIQLIFLPFQKEGSYDLSEILPLIRKDKPLFILAHCPAFSASKKQYYVEVYNAVEAISKHYGKNVYFIHGHIHPSKSYNYKLQGLAGVSLITPKAEESIKGINLDHHVIQINLVSGKIQVIDSVTMKKTDFEELPSEYYSNEEHWNEFKLCQKQKFI